MDSITGLSLINSAGSVVSSLGRFIPKPRTSGASFTTTIQDIGTSLVNVGAAATGLGGELDPLYQGLIQMQLDAQKQMLLMSTVSNIEKTKHETQMVAARNIRVG